MDPTTWAANSALERLQAILERRKAPEPLDKNAIGPLSAESLVEDSDYRPPKRAAPEPAGAAVGGGARRRDRALLDDGRSTQAPHLRRGARRHTDQAERAVAPHMLPSRGQRGRGLEHRQWLEREHPEAFVSGEALERVLAELEERTVKLKDHYGRDTEKHGSFYMTKAESGEWRAVTKDQGFGGDAPVEIAFPSAMALSHMWLDKAHPDMNARNLRDMWLPAIEWLYSERVRQLGGEHAVGEKDKYGYGRAKDADGTPLSDEAVLAAADFGLFVDLSSMCQKENDRRTEVEDGLFRHSLGSLDVVYAHKSLMSLLDARAGGCGGRSQLW